jgi:hypothetical protein
MYIRQTFSEGTYNTGSVVYVKNTASLNNKVFTMANPGLVAG